MKRRTTYPGATSYIDRHGRTRWRYRRGGVSMSLGTVYGSPDFCARYAEAVKREATKAPPLDKIDKGTVAALIRAWRKSPRYARLDGRWKMQVDAVLARIEKRDGHRLVADLRAEHLETRLAEMVETPAAANRWLKTWRRLLDHAQRIGWIAGNPAKLVEMYPAKTAGYHTWTDDEIAQYEAHHPVGSTARLAFALMLYTGAAKVDAVRLGPAHVRDGRVRFRRSKTSAEIDIPLHPALAPLLPGDRLTFLETAEGKGRTANGLGNAMRGWCDAAGLPGCTSHGLRKACARRLAEAGATASEIASVTGHAGLEEVERYTRAASRSKLADSAMGKVIRIGGK